MNAAHLEAPAKPLLVFGKMLGMGRDDWHGHEGLQRIEYVDEHLHSEWATALSTASLQDVLGAYGDALTCRFLLGDRTLLTLAPGLDDAALARFRRELGASPSLRLELTLDKSRLLELWVGAVPGCQLFLYLFPRALHRLVCSPLSVLEGRLWQAEAPAKAVLLVRDHGIWLDGPCLSVLGGERVARVEEWREKVVRQLPDANRLREIYSTCRQRLNWEHHWLSYLTPLHVEVSGEARGDDPIAQALRVHLANAILLFTADRTTGTGKQPERCQYAAGRRKVEMPWGDVTAPPCAEAKTGSEALAKAFQWAYTAPWAAERLDLVQRGMIDRLWSAPEEQRFELLLRAAPDVREGLEWHWAAVVQEKLDGYYEQVRSLEDYVRSSVQGYDDQASGMIKHLSDTMLAAVAAVLGSLVAALFKEPFNAAVFRIGLWLYAAYVFFFPLGYGLLQQREVFRAQGAAFDEQRKRFEQRLQASHVQDVVGGQLKSARARFDRWFAATGVAYAAVIVLALLAAWVLPGWVGRR